MHSHIQCAALLSSPRPGPPVCDSCFVPCWWRFCGCPWSCGFDTEGLLSAKASILQLQGSLGCLLCCHHFILGKFLSFLGDEAWATFAPAQVILEGLEPCFVIQVSKSGCGAWEFPARAVTTAHQKWVPWAPPLSHFSKAWVLWFFFKLGYA